ncbi:hypothetical protein [Paenibacillus durus]|uniref:hypothetical protein n=1 Tax=Paenibacillus durus TaxID=44251 RepID=UPI0012DE9491|nr:hypothetical protein [Paenibacillus durus]
MKKNNGKTGTSSGKVSVKPSPPVHKLKTRKGRSADESINTPESEARDARYRDMEPFYRRRCDAAAKSAG